MGQCLKIALRSAGGHGRKEGPIGISQGTQCVLGFRGLKTNPRPLADGQAGGSMMM